MLYLIVEEETPPETTTVSETTKEEEPQPKEDTPPEEPTEAPVEDTPPEEPVEDTPTDEPKEDTSPTEQPVEDTPTTNQEEPPVEDTPPKEEEEQPKDEEPQELPQAEQEEGIYINPVMYVYITFYIGDAPSEPSVPPRTKYYSVAPDDPVELLMGKSDLSAADPKTVGQLFKEAVSKFGTKPALAYKDSPDDQWTRVTYSEFYDKCVSAAKSFLKVSVAIHIYTICVKHMCI